MSLWLLLASAVLVLALAGAAHAALRFAGRIWLRHWVGKRHEDGAVDAILSDQGRLAAGATAIVTLTAVSAGVVLAARLGANGKQLLLVSGVFLTSCVILGRWAPRMAARRWPHVVAGALIPFLKTTAKLTAPLRAVTRVLVKKSAGPDSLLPPHRADVENLLREGTFEGAGAPDEMEIISGVMQLGDRKLRDVMTPRSEIFGADASDPPLETARRAAAAGYSRVPVYRESLDRIVGMLHVFDLLNTGGRSMPPIREVAYASESKPCSEMLFEMLRAQRHLAVVLDVNGDTAGIVTLEDVLEELVGEIRDEHDGEQGDTELLVATATEVDRSSGANISARRADPQASLENLSAP